MTKLNPEAVEVRGVSVGFRAFGVKATAVGWILRGVSEGANPVPAGWGSADGFVEGRRREWAAL